MTRRLLALFALLWWALAAHAQPLAPIPPLSGRVIDQSGTLSSAQQGALTEKLAAIEAKRGSQIVVLIVPTTQPEDIASYGYRVADAWKIGRRDVGDGIVVIVAKNDRRINIEIAKALEGAIPDVLAGRIIAEQIKPAFKADDYAGGLNAAIDRLDKAIGGEALPAPSRGAQKPSSNRGGFDFQDLAIFLFVGVPILGAILTGVLGRKLGALVTGGAVGGIGFWLTTSLLVAAGAGLIAMFLVGVMGMGAASRLGRGSGGPIIWGGGGGGGFGGFGGGGGGGGGGGFSSGCGGDFGGGGASGSW